MYALLLGGLCIGFAPVLVRLADTGPVASGFWRLALAAPLLWLLSWRASRTSNPPNAASMSPAPQRASSLFASATWSPALLLAGVFFAADLGTWHFSIRDTTVANATLLANCAPLLITLQALLIHRRSPPRLYFLALALALGGAFVLVSPNFSAGSRQLRGDALGLLAAVFYSGYMLAVKSASARHATLRLMAVSTSVSALLLCPVALWLSHHSGQPFWPGSSRGWWIVAALALLTQVIGQGLIASALGRLSVTLSSTGLLVQPAVSAVAAWLLFGESLRPVQIAGGLVLMVGIWLARRSQT